jgi:hypothetical protein
MTILIADPLSLICFKGIPQFLRCLIRRDLSGPLLRHDHVISMTGQSLSMTTKKFSEQSFDPVTDHRIPHLSADGNAESVLSLVIGSAQDHKMGGVNFLPSP